MRYTVAGKERIGFDTFRKVIVLVSSVAPHSTVSNPCWHSLCEVCRRKVVENFFVYIPGSLLFWWLWRLVVSVNVKFSD